MNMISAKDFLFFRGPGLLSVLCFISKNGCWWSNVISSALSGFLRFRILQAYVGTGWDFWTVP